MAKSVYRIPTSLDRSTLDHEVALSGGGWTMRPLPLKVLLFWAVSLLVMFWVTTSTFVKSADLWLIALVVIWWLAATGFFGAYSKTKEMNFSLVPALMAFVPKANRHVVTRRNANASGFYSILGIKEMDDNGFIRFLDGTVGQFYLVVGSASVLVFEQDKNDMIDRVTAFWQKADTKTELNFITTKEPQRVWRQLGNLERLNKGLRNRDPELLALMDERYDVLRNYVGEQFNSIHQYMLIKSDNLDALRRAHSIVMDEQHRSTLMFKQVESLDGKDTREMLKSIYQVDAA